MARIFLLAWFAAANLVGAVATVADKRRARAGRGRIPEAALLGTALAGGWPLQLVAMLTVRHKTRKGSFLLAFALCAAADLALAYAAWRAGMFK